MNAFPVNNSLSLYIPHVFPNIDGERIRRIFRNLDIGNVSRVDFVAKFDRQGKEYNSVYIHFAQWFNTPVATNFQTRVLNPEVEAKLVYDDPWFWVVLPNSGKQRIINGRKPCLDLGEPVLRSRPVVRENYCETYHECLEYEEKEEMLPFYAADKLNKAKERVKELTELLVEYGDCIGLSRKEIFALERMSRELSFLEEELQNRELRAAVDAVEDQDYVEEERYILDSQNDNHYLTREEAQQRVREIGRIIVEEYPVCPTTEQFGEIASLQFESEELKKLIRDPVPQRLIEDVIDELLEEMEDCERFMDVADCV